MTIRTAAAAFAMLGAAVVATPATAQETMRFMTGPQGGSWVPIAGALKNIWERAIPGLTVQTLPGAGVANVRGIGGGRANVAFGNSISTVDGIAGRAPFPEAVSNVCNIGSLYPQWFQVIALADSGINSIEDMRGRPIALQPRGNTAEVVTQHILQAAGMRYSDVRASFQSSYTDAVGLLRDGHAQVFTLGTTIPASAVMDLASAREMRIVDLSRYVDKMREINPGYQGAPLPANTYPQQQGTPTQITYTAHLITNCDRNPDQVYQMVKLMWDNVGTLRNIVSAMRDSTPATAAADIGVPMHPGAARFYQEAASR
ncbi:TAXI family TRAP transporter solute-binding subunit [Roseomonas frigidaquae]|uniref:TAXI family TRAP transporter solute-binding subunit n=1 Tax=Falsiroseomonas frigidaquae TaxID=487318 RepID=A0ABX1F5J2_9PROT|nr:TAXI family TRAP transporter solute-binding subunit [Falsiroseomonas frigidaquae]NKE47491.1 TAXI family TRAP transporter solute-binding subunit [Falsiroseomonas frigidaquae]